MKAFFERWERIVDRFAYSPWSSVALFVYSVVWIVIERGNIGFDGFATIVGIELCLAIRRWQGRK